MNPIGHEKKTPDRLPKANPAFMKKELFPAGYRNRKL